MNARTERGFTLIEVLVALMVVAVGLTAVVQGANRSLKDTAAIRDKTFATWVGANVLTEYQVAGAWRRGDRREQREFAGRRWPVRVRIGGGDATGGDDRRSITVAVHAPDDPERRLQVVHGQLTRPAESGP